MLLKKSIFNDLLISVAWLFSSGSRAKKLDSSLEWFTKNADPDTSSSVMKILNVAEKNDAAKNIANILSGGKSRRRDGFSLYNKIYEFECTVDGQKSVMAVTSVSGHILSYEFVPQFRSWNKCNPLQLFEAPIIKNCTEDSQQLKKTLEKEAKSAHKLIIWTDCDREGENIGYEVISVCTAVKPDLKIYRAKFSEITKRSIWHALEHLIAPNQRLSNAVDVRSELDLRIGAAFTRFQTLRLQKVFPNQLSDCLISYGSCQFPTLGFVVERYNAVQSFVPEPFWKIKVEHKVKDLTVEFNWKRVRLFDELMCRTIYEKCLEDQTAKVEKVVSKPKSKWRPVPLDTIEFEKIASRKLGINAKEAMRIAEKLYTQGFISYPRTETNIFPKQMDLSPFVQMQTGDQSWGDFADNILQEGPNPRQGKKTDEAHPPIHPTKYTNLFGNEQKVYEYIVRHFLACVSKDAKGHETIVDIDIKGEKFVASGLAILERNYLDVYPYEKWNAKEIHEYRKGQVFRPTNFSMVDGETSPPNLLTEADLIGLMEKHGIGTDATHADHIETIKTRLYVGLTDQKYFIPGQLGMGLVEGYDSMGFAMSKPNLRADLEADLKGICEGAKDPKVVLQEQIQRYKQVFIESAAQVDKIDVALGKYLEADPVPFQDRGTGMRASQFYEPVFKCPLCGNDMVLRKRANDAGFFIGCTGYPNCKSVIWLPSTVTSVTVADNTCPQCGPTVKMLNFNFRPGALAPYYPNTYVGCVNGCDPQFLSLLKIRPITGNVAPASEVAAESGRGRASWDGGRGTFGRGSGFSQQTVGGYGASNQFQSERARPPPAPRFTERPAFQFDRQTNNQPSRTMSEQGANDYDDTVCNCGEPARRFIVQKESVNKGRPFFKCSKMGDDACSFFQWGDDLGTGAGGNAGRLNNQGGSAYNRRAGSSSDTQTARKCSLCHQTGHTRRNCPNQR